MIVYDLRRQYLLEIDITGGPQTHIYTRPPVYEPENRSLIFVVNLTTAVQAIYANCKSSELSQIRTTGERHRSTQVIAIYMLRDEYQDAITISCSSLDTQHVLASYTQADGAKTNGRK